MKGSRLSGWLTLAVFATVGGVIAADPAFAKVDVDKFTIGGEARIRYEYRTNAGFSTTTNANESAASHRVRVSVGYDLTPDVSFFAQLQDARVWGSECNAAVCGAATTGIGTVSSANNGGTGVDLHQGYIQVKNILTPGLSMKLGRQEITFGDHRLFGNFGWSQIGNSFDAVRLTHASPMADLDLFWARIADTEGGALGSNGGAAAHGVIFPAAGAKATTDQDIYGAYLTLKPVANWTIEPYYFLLKDSRANGGTLAGVVATPQAPDQSLNTLGGRINGKAAGLDATVEGVYQFGGIGDIAGAGGHNLAVHSYAGAAKAGYTLEVVPMKPRLGVEFDYAKGDSCVAPGTCNAVGHLNTFDNLYPTNHFHYGYMDLMAWKNMVNYQANFAIQPDAASKLQVNFIIHRLQTAHDNWYRAGQGVYGATSAANTSSSIGRELDVHYWRTFKEKFKAEIGYGHFWAGQYITSGLNTIDGVAGGHNGSGQNWGYVMGSVLF